MPDPYDIEKEEEEDDSQEESEQEDSFFDDPFMAFLIGPFLGDGL